MPALIAALAAAATSPTAVVAIISAVFGFLFHWALPPLRKVVDTELSRAEKEYQQALRALAAAEKTPDPSDDAAARKLVAARYDVRVKLERLKAVVDGIPA